MLKINTILFMFSSIVVLAEIPKFNLEYPFTHAPETMYGKQDSITWTSAGGKYVSITHADWDNDGDKDIFSGYMNKNGGKSSIKYFENIGTDKKPKFKYKLHLPIDVGGA